MYVHLAMGSTAVVESKFLVPYIVMLPQLTSCKFDILDSEICI
jgi:hypothetical protein